MQMSQLSYGRQKMLLVSYGKPLILFYFISYPFSYLYAFMKDLLQIPAAKSIMFGIDSITFRGSLLWNSMPDLIKSASSAAIFKRNIKNWSGDKCKCKICR